MSSENNMFNVNSGLVQVWIDLIKKDTYSIEQVPQVNNLKEVIQGLLQPSV